MRYVFGRLLKWSLLISFLVFSSSACLTDAGDEGNVEFEPGAPDFVPVLPENPEEPSEPVFDYSKAVCDPLGSGSPDRTQGLLGSLHYLTDDQPRYGSAVEYVENGHLVDVSLFFSHLFVPTRPFDRGFETRSGSIIETEKGDTLYEYFGIHMESDLVLTDDQSAGSYQFAILSDDGAVLKNRATGGVIVDNDGVHPTRMGCSDDMNLDGSPLPVSLNYYQGPRYHISLIVMMRPTPTDGSSDPLCGRQGNSLFFDSTVDPPAALPAYEDLFDRGWRVLTTDNYKMPGGTSNPCPDQTPAPIISNVQVAEIASTAALLTWTTDLPATSQVEVTNLFTGQVFLTDFDPSLKTSHSVTVSGLAKRTLYQVKAISESSSSEQSISDPRFFKTLP